MVKEVFRNHDAQAHTDQLNQNLWEQEIDINNF